MVRITVISDTHTKHKQIVNDLPGGDLLIHAGDISSMGYHHEINNFCGWFDKLHQYEEKVFICGNHDFGFQDYPEEVRKIIDRYHNIDYLQDNRINVFEDRPVSIWGSPWQPEFCGWAFNLPRNSDIMKSKWDMIPEDIDILITHGPPFGHLDVVKGRTDHLGCEVLAERLKIVKPKIHIFGHIHSARHIYERDGTVFVNASVLNEQYYYKYKPITFDFDFDTKKLEIINV